MITKTSKSASIRKVFTPMGLALSMALMLGLAALVLVMPVTVSASAQTPEANSIGKVCGYSEPQLYLSKPQAAKPDGAKQPLDLLIKLTDEAGNPVMGAKVMARATDFETFVDAPLSDMGNGLYSSCAFGYFNGKGEGALRIHVRAEKGDYRSAASDGSNNVGRQCSVSDTTPSR